MELGEGTMINVPTIQDVGVEIDASVLTQKLNTGHGIAVSLCFPTGACLVKNAMHN